MTATAPKRSRAPIYEGSRIPFPIPTVLKTTPEVEATGDVMTVNFGPNHPSTHGVLRLVLDLFELVAGYRMHTRYFQVGGLAEDIPRGFFPEARKFCDGMPKAIDDYETLLT